MHQLVRRLLIVLRTASAHNLTGESFKSDLGGFGEPHIDCHDSPGGWTVMISKSDLAPGERPGWFIVADLGAVIGKSTPAIVMMFSLICCI